jgi:deoxycytidylate deaminase
MSSASFLSGCQLYGWKPDPSLSRDGNYMDLCMIVTRNSKLRQGSMCCVLVRGDQTPEQDQAKNRDGEEATKGTVTTTVESIYNDILVVTNNMPFYKPNDSEIHAEIAAIGQASKQGITVNGATAYITMPPCPRCLPALCVAGIKRIVSRHPLNDNLQAAATKHGIVYEKIDKQENEKRMERINQLVRDYEERKRSSAFNTSSKEPESKKTKSDKAL